MGYRKRTGFLAGADRVLIPYADAAAEAVDNLFGGSGKQTAELDGRSNAEGVT